MASPVVPGVSPEQRPLVRTAEKIEPPIPNPSQENKIARAEAVREAFEKIVRENAGTKAADEAAKILKEKWGKVVMP